jgi:hypothetical protein
MQKKGTANGSAAASLWRDELRIDAKGPFGGVLHSSLEPCLAVGLAEADRTRIDTRELLTGIAL